MKPAFPLPPSKLPRVGTTIFTVMSALARQNQAINLSQGFPDFDCDPLLHQLTTQALQSGHNQYAPMPGVPQLRQEIARFVADQYEASFDPDQEITVCSGATEAIFCAIQALVQAGDEVLVIEPAYDSYVPAIRLSGGIPVPVCLHAPDYQIDWQEVESKINARTRLLILNSPHNPTGRMLAEADIKALQALAHKHHFWIISDEVYENICFDGRAHLSLARYPDLRDRTLVISSFGKSLHITGWKVGYCLAPKALSGELRKVHQFVTFSTSTPFQLALAQYLKSYRDRFLSVGSLYQQKRDLFLQLMQDSPFRPLPCEGTYFQLMDYSNISDLGDFEFSKRLTIEHGVACIPVSVFYEQAPPAKVVRFCFAKKDETLIAAAEKLKKVKM